MVTKAESTKTNIPADIKKDEGYIDAKVEKDETKKDLSKRDKFFNKLSQKIKDTILRKTTRVKTTQTTTETTTKTENVGKIPLNWKKLLPFSPLLIIILFALYVQLFSKGKVNKTETNTFPTPTYSPYQKFKPSIYADDPVVIKLEETINVLDREMSTTPLTESTLTPPILDFDIGF